MFTLLSPQRARNLEGHIVQVADRHSVEFVDGLRKATVEVEFGRPISVYASTLDGWISGETRSTMDTSEADMVLSQISAGLRAMGSQVEIVRDN